MEYAPFSQESQADPFSVYHSVLTEEERAAGDCMMICVSRSCTARLVLDL